MSTKLRKKPILGTVCPKCGIAEGVDNTIQIANSLSSFTRQGYEVKLCRKCQQIQESSSGVFDFNRRV